MINFISSSIILMMALCGECRHAFIFTTHATTRNVIVDVQRKTSLRTNTLPTDDVSDINNVGGAGGSTSIESNIEKLRQKAARLRAEATVYRETPAPTTESS